MMKTRRLLFLLSMQLFFIGLYAEGEVTFSIDRFSIMPGETVDVALKMTNSTNVQIFNGTIRMSGGLSFVGVYDEDEEEDVYVFRTARLHKKHEIGFNLSSPNTMTFLVHSGTTRRDISGTEGPVLIFKVRADGSMPAGTVQIQVEELSAVNSENVELCSTSTFPVSVYVGTPIIKDERNNSYVKDGDNGLKLVEGFSGYGDNSIVIPASVSADGNDLAVTTVANDAFDIPNKSEVSLIDLSATALTDIVADRNDGLFKGYEESTLICLPEGTGNQQAAGETNVVIGDECAELLVVEDMEFKTRVAFTAKHATFDRTFASGKTATVYLPFSIPSGEANKLGTFHTFKGITDEGTAEFNSAETGDVQANVPYIFIPNETIEKIAVTDEAGNISVPVTGSAAGVNGSLIGTTTSIIWDEENAPVNIYGFAAEDKGNVTVGTFVKAAVGASIARYRAYLVISAAEARNSYPVVIDNDQVSGITDLDAQEHAIKKEYFDMRGIRQKGVPVKKSVYIVNGHKVVIK